MIGRRPTVAATRTLAARIAKLEEARPSDEVSQALAKELMELMKKTGAVNQRRRFMLGFNPAHPSFEREP